MLYFFLLDHLPILYSFNLVYLYIIKVRARTYLPHCLFQSTYTFDIDFILVLMYLYTVFIPIMQ